jgi:hypothetical protein
MMAGISKGQHKARTRLSPNALARCDLSDYQASITVAERWRSGRTWRSRKPLSLYGFPGFESLSLRQKPHIFR